MQKLLRRTELAKRQAARKARAHRAQQEGDISRTYGLEIAQVRKAQVGHINQAKKNFREDWKFGPLAPRRDVGDFKDAYGTVDSQTIQHPTVPYSKRARWPHIYKGDRVVILEGPDRAGSARSRTSKETKRR